MCFDLLISLFSAPLMSHNVEFFISMFVYNFVDYVFEALVDTLNLKSIGVFWWTLFFTKIS